jgi:uncharacterized lipoprotein YbaY
LKNLTQGRPFMSCTIGSSYIIKSDVSSLDAPSRIIVKQVIPGISHEIGTENRVKFALETEKLNERASYSIRVHVSFNEDEQINCGDYINTENYPVLTFGYPNHVSVRVQKVE